VAVFFVEIDLLNFYGYYYNVIHKPDSQYMSRDSHANVVVPFVTSLLSLCEYILDIVEHVLLMNIHEILQPMEVEPIH
jgi:hypothetical protein